MNQKDAIITIGINGAGNPIELTVSYPQEGRSDHQFVSLDIAKQFAASIIDGTVGYIEEVYAEPAEEPEDDETPEEEAEVAPKKKTTKRKTTKKTNKR